MIPLINLNLIEIYYRFLPVFEVANTKVAISWNATYAKLISSVILNRDLTITIKNSSDSYGSIENQCSENRQRIWKWEVKTCHWSPMMREK